MASLSARGYTRSSPVAAALAGTTRAAASAPAPSGAAANRMGRETLADRLATLLSGQIEGGTLAPGDRLPTEARLAQLHGVSRSVVREAVHRIKSRGLLTSRQGSGVYVAEPARHRALEFDPTVLDSVDAVGQVLEVRRVLEGETAALAAARATRAQVAALRRALAALDAAAAAGDDGAAEDLAFHRVIGEATGNPQFGRLLGFLEQYLSGGMRGSRGNEAHRADFMDAVRKAYRQIVDAIAAGDPAAARRAATQHLGHGARRLGRGGVPAPRVKPVAAKPQQTTKAAQ